MPSVADGNLARPSQRPKRNLYFGSAALHSSTERGTYDLGDKSDGQLMGWSAAETLKCRVWGQEAFHETSRTRHRSG
jgi:hypothetical protein